MVTYVCKNASSNTYTDSYNAYVAIHKLVLAIATHTCMMVHGVICRHIIQADDAMMMIP